MGAAVSALSVLDKGAFTLRMFLIICWKILRAPRVMERPRSVFPS